jgi:hypothetical protein
VLSLGVISRVVDLLSSVNVLVQLEALRVIGSIASGPEALAQRILDFGSLPVLIGLIGMLLLKMCAPFYGVVRRE